MATLYITEYIYSARSSIGQLMAAAQEPANAVQTVAISGISIQSQPFSTGTSFVRVHCDETCSIAFGFNPTATTSSTRLAANQTEFFGITIGHRLAVIANN